MPYFIFKDTRREAESKRQEALAKEGRNPREYRGVARSAEEAHDIQRKLEREGEAFDKIWVVSGESAEAKQAHTDELLKARINPETWESLHSPSTRHDG